MKGLNVRKASPFYLFGASKPVNRDGLRTLGTGLFSLERFSPATSKAR